LYLKIRLICATADETNHQQRRRLEHISVVAAAAALPKAKVHFAVGLAVFEITQELGRRFTQMLEGAPRDRRLEGRADAADLVDGLLGPKKHVHVFRHDHVRPEAQVQVGPGRFQGVHQPPSGSIFAQKCLSAEAREGQLVSMGRDVVTLDAFAVRGGHGESVPWLFGTEYVAGCA
jgi:hypothetical protein